MTKRPPSMGADFEGTTDQLLGEISQVIKDPKFLRLTVRKAGEHHYELFWAQSD